MKFMNIILLALSLSSFAHAAQVPGCWDPSNDKLADGSFLVFFKTAEVSKDAVRGALVGPNLQTGLLQDLGVDQLWEVHAYNPTGLSRDELIQAVTQQLQAVADIPNVNLGCNWMAQAAAM